MVMPTPWVTCTSVKASLRLKSIYRFCSIIFCHLDNMFFSEVTACHSKTKPSRFMCYNSVNSKVYGYYTWLPAVRTCAWHIMKSKIEQWRTQTVKQLYQQSVYKYIKQDWDRISLLKQLVSFVPKSLQSIVKRKGAVTQW